MYLSRLYIKNFRSIKELDLEFNKGKTVIVGRNNAGKSNIIKAIDLVLGESSPTYQKSDNITDNDFYSWKEIMDGREHIRVESELFIWCELLREENEELDYDKLYECYGYSIYAEITSWANGRPNKSYHRIPSFDLPDRYHLAFNETEDANSGKIYINVKQRHLGPLEQELEDKHRFALAFRGQRTQEGKLTKEIRLFYRENEQTDWIMSFRAPFRCELLQSAIIPSFRDPRNQLHLSNWSWYGKLMRHLTDGYEQDDTFINALATVNNVASDIFSEVTASIQESSLKVAFPGTQVSFQFNAESRVDLYKSCLIYIDDGFKSQLNEKGSGIQSALIIGLFNYYTRNVNTITSALLCIEEPEIYLHPHARRVINNRLDDFLDRNRNQVILSTHSVEFVNTTKEDLSIILVQKDDQQTIAKPIRTHPFKHLLINNNQNEIFFADKVVICEGLDDYILRAIGEVTCPGLLDEQNVSIISVDGKDNLSEMAKLVLRLGLKCFIFADFDYLLRDTGEEREKYPDAKAHRSILSLGEGFFLQTCIFGSQGRERYQDIQRLRANLKRDYEELFYTAKVPEEFNEFDFSEELNTLRRNGIFVLSGEIENYCKDENFLKPKTKKLSLQKVYELNRKLDEDLAIDDLFLIDEFQEFLGVVISR